MQTTGPSSHSTACASCAAFAAHRIFQEMKNKRETGRFDGAMTRELYSECRALEGQRYGTGTRTARAPTEERSGAPTSSRLPTRWTGRLRRAREGADDGDSGGRASRQRREVGEEAADERAALGAEAAGGSTDDEEDPTRQLFDGPGDDGLGARGQKRAREPDELADLLEETDRRKAREAEMRARVAAEMAARMDTGIRVNAELAEWAGVPRRLKRAEESPPEGEPSAKRRETP
jgi:hypothetical protein